jgi:hypothetical protein
MVGEEFNRFSQNFTEPSLRMVIPDSIPVKPPPDEYSIVKFILSGRVITNEQEIPIIIIVNTLIILRNRFIWYLHRSLQNREIKIALPVELDINTLIHSG